MKKYESFLGSGKIIKDQSLLRHEDIRKQIRILPELQSLIPPLHPAEYAQLEENIQKEGCREALLVWETTESLLDGDSSQATVYVLIDGHNRFSICQRHGLDFKIHLVSFDSLADVRFYMIDNQLGRRNLNPEQSSYLRGLRYLNEKQEKGKYDRQLHKGQNDPYEDPVGSTSEKLAHRYNVSEKTIKRDADFAQGLRQLAVPLRTAILSGQTKISKGLLQQISRLDQPSKPLETLAEIEALVQNDQHAKKGLPRASEEIPLEVIALKKQLVQFIQQLEQDTGKEVAICNQIIRCSQQIKEKLKTA